MTPPSSDLPATARELDILQVLWDHKDVTLRQLHDQLSAQFEYTTLQTMLDRMVKKGLVEKVGTRPARHRATITRGNIMRKLLRLAVNKVTGGPMPLVLELLKDRNLAPEDLADIRQVIENAERKSREDSQ